MNLSHPYPCLLNLDGLNASRKVVETLDADDGVRQPRLAQQLLPPGVVVALRALVLEGLRVTRHHEATGRAEKLR